MKRLFTISALIFSLGLSAQDENVIGNYELSINAENGDIKYSLSLNSDRTFIFHFYRHLNCSSCVEENQYGKGTWKEDKKLISFSVDNTIDLDEKHILNFNNSKARFDIKSPRNKTNQVINTKLRFYKSEIFWVKGMELIKK